MRLLMGRACSTNRDEVTAYADSRGTANIVGRSWSSGSAPAPPFESPEEDGSSEVDQLLLYRLRLANQSQMVGISVRAHILGNSRIRDSIKQLYFVMIVNTPDKTIR